MIDQGACIDSREVMKACGRRIQQARDARGWSQGDLGARVGRTDSAVSAWEQGDAAISVPMLAAVAKALDVSMELLLPIAENDPLAELKSVLVLVPAAWQRYMLANVCNLLKVPYPCDGISSPVPPQPLGIGE